MKYAISFILPFLLSVLLAVFQVANGYSVLLRGSAMSAIPVLFMSIVILILGIVVLQYKRGKYPRLSGIQASRVYFLAYAGTLSGLILLGIWGGTVVGEFAIWQIIFSRFNGEVLALISALILLICSVISVRFCQIDTNEKC